MARLLITLLLCCVALAVRAEIYKRVDAEGHVTYSSTPLKGATRLYLEPLAEKPSPLATVMPAASQPAHAEPPPHAIPYRPHGNDNTPNHFPRVDSGTQHGRDLTRQKILTDELNSEQQMLAEALQKQRDALRQPEVDSARQGEKMTALQAQIRLHEKNISALKTELARHHP